jgi:hypothetical protein
MGDMLVRFGLGRVLHHRDLAGRAMERRFNTPGRASGGFRTPFQDAGFYRYDADALSGAANETA